MLAKLRLRNFRSFKEDTVIDFTATKYSKLKDTNVSGGVLKGCLFAGDNDSGKSNAINAISILLYLLFDDTDFNMPVNFCFFSAGPSYGNGVHVPFRKRGGCVLARL